jgi:hypothetical protein
MKNYRVSIWTTVDVEAGNELIAEEIARDMLTTGEIKNRDFFTNAEIQDCDHELNYDDQQSEPHKGNEYYYCKQCRESFVYDSDNDKLIKQSEGN